MSEYGIVEPTFSSGVPLVGPAIVAFRRAWNWMSTKWYVLPIVEQQNAINARFVDVLAEYAETDRIAISSAIAAERGVHETRGDVALAAARLVAAEREIAELRAETARLRDMIERSVSATPSQEAGENAPR